MPWGPPLGLCGVDNAQSVTDGSEGASTWSTCVLTRSRTSGVAVSLSHATRLLKVSTMNMILHHMGQIRTGICTKVRSYLSGSGEGHIPS